MTEGQRAKYAPSDRYPENCKCGSPIFLKCAGCGRAPSRCLCGDPVFEKKRMAGIIKTDENNRIQEAHSKAAIQKQTGDTE